MATLTIRDFDEGLKAQLRIRAAEHGHSMEAEVREILASVLARSACAGGMGSRIRRRFSDAHDAPVALPSRSEPARAAELPDDHS
jgi:hypothetical protein